MQSQPLSEKNVAQPVQVLLAATRHRNAYTPGFISGTALVKKGALQRSAPAVIFGFVVPPQRPPFLYEKEPRGDG